MSEDAIAEVRALREHDAAAVSGETIAADIRASVAHLNGLLARAATVGVRVEIDGRVDHCFAGVGPVYAVTATILRVL